ncbi:MAG: 5-formyltetrahydrofolate cyclo-ligase [Chitinophagaceae bacterium]
MTTKATLRNLYLDKRKALSHKQVLVATDLMLIQFQRLHLPSMETVLSYRPILSKQEIDMEHFESYLQLTNPSVIFCYPVSDLESCTFHAVPTDDDTAFSMNAWGIEEPQSIESIDPKAIDLVFVPLLVFDKKGFRVGYGKGFYDKFLTQCRPDVMKIGFSCFPPVDTISDTDTLDIPLNVGITPDEIYVFP